MENGEFHQTLNLKASNMEKEICQLCGENEIELQCPRCGNEMCGNCTSEDEEYDCICTECMNIDYFMR